LPTEAAEVIPLAELLNAIFPKMLAGLDYIEPKLSKAALDEESLAYPAVLDPSS
jgi:hypothetical protein